MTKTKKFYNIQLDKFVFGAYIIEKEVLEMSEETTLVVQLPKELEKQLRAHYDEMIVTAVE